MKEDFLHYAWKLKKIRFLNSTTSKGEPIEILSVGVHNHNSGPDFLHARIKIAGQLWAGNVEIHVKSSDWYLHGHEKDDHYNNVILHVVWEHDTEIFRRDNSMLPTLILSECISEHTLKSYQNLITQPKAFINCEKSINQIDAFIMENWLARLYFERLEAKSKPIFQELKTSKNNWEAVLFKLLMKNFGLKVNGESFYSIANAVDYSIVRKIKDNPLQLEALFFGLAGLLEDSFTASYSIRLKKEYAYLEHKFKLSNQGIIRPKFFKLRPANFPTIRLSQIARLYSTRQHLFSKIISSTQIEDFYTLFNVSTSEYWQQHYTWEKSTAKKEKKLSKSFIQLMIINTILPLKQCYAIQMGKDISDEIHDIIKALPSEYNSIIKKYEALNINVSSAMESQALLQLYNTYCSKHKCLQCVIGNTLIAS